MSVVATTSATSGAGSATTSGINTTGANSIFVVQAWYYGAPGDPTFSDSNGNTWVPRTTYRGTGSGQVKILYCAAPTVGSGHTFTQVSTSQYGSFVVVAMTETLAATPFDQENGGGSSGPVTTVQPGSVTPSENGELLICGLNMQTAGLTASIDSSFTIAAQLAAQSGVSYGSALAYLVQATAGAINPTWTVTSSVNDLSSSIATFKLTGGGGGGSTTPLNIITPNQGIVLASAARRSI